MYFERYPKKLLDRNRQFLAMDFDSFQQEMRHTVSEEPGWNRYHPCRRFYSHSAAKYLGLTDTKLAYFRFRVFLVMLDICKRKWQ